MGLSYTSFSITTNVALAVDGKTSDTHLLVGGEGAGGGRSAFLWTWNRMFQNMKGIWKEWTLEFDMSHGNRWIDEHWRVNVSL